ncbi:MAG TPA: hypothetical protein VD902_14695 [Symbiobacteriaceae bacterium]|nr:hypothetical protein [Symbiobacteriaceae bacterium]
MVTKDPYARSLFAKSPYHSATPIEGKLCVVLDGHLTGRGLTLIKPPSRAVQKHEIHELILTDEMESGPGSTVERVWYSGFFEVLEGGMAIVGSPVTVDGQEIGVLAGFDETHLPNHLNIIVKTASPATGADMNLKLGAAVTFAGR